MRKVAAAIIGVTVLGVTSIASANEVTVKIINKSKYEIHEMYLSPTKQQEWGPDQLRDDKIATGASFELRKIPVGKYDFKVVDEDGDECIVADIKVTTDENVELNDELLVGCQAATEKAAGDEGEDEEEGGE